jgi:hydroxyacylglutathione hydrolase
MFFKQLKCIGDNFSYIVADEIHREAIVIDPSYNAKTIIRLAKVQGLNVRHIINTHHHMDHTAGNIEVKRVFGSKVVAYKTSRIDKDVAVSNGDNLRVGDLAVKVIHTPGHTPDSICLLVDDKLFTGDTLFVGECGRTDLSEGNARDMYNSLFNQLMKLDDEIKVYPGHDYGSRPNSTIGVERKTNYTLEKRSLEEFIEFMKEP